MKIDAHQHFWQYNPEEYSWLTDEMAKIRKDFSPEDLEPVLEKNGIDGCVVVQVRQSEEETQQLLEYAAEHEFIKAVVGWVDLTADNVEDRLEYFSQQPLFRGIRHTVWDERGEFMEAPEFQRGISGLKKFGLSYDILAFDEQLGAALNLVKNFPEQVFVLDHMGKPVVNGAPSKEWKNNIAELGKQPQVYCKLSGLFTQVEGYDWKKAHLSPYLDVVLEAFGTDRLMFGSDWPVSLVATSYDEGLEFLHNYFRNFSEEEKAAIFGLNAARGYKLQ
jgi:L-fuconolactonase